MPNPRPPRPFPDYLPNILDSLMFLKLNSRTVQQVATAVRFLGSVYIGELEVGVLKKTHKLSAEELEIDLIKAKNGYLGALSVEGREDEEYTLDVQGSVLFNFSQNANEKVVFGERPTLGRDSSALMYGDSFVTYKDVLSQGFLKKGELAQTFMPVDSSDQPKVELKGKRLEFDYSVGEDGGVHFHAYPEVDLDFEGAPKGNSLVTADYVYDNCLPRSLKADVTISNFDEGNWLLTINPRTTFTNHVTFNEHVTFTEHATSAAVFDVNTPSNAFITKEYLSNLSDLYLPLKLEKNTTIKTDNWSTLTIDPTTSFTGYVNCNARMVDDQQSHIPDTAFITKKYVIDNYVPSYIPEGHRIGGNGTLIVNPDINFLGSLVNDSEPGLTFGIGLNQQKYFAISSHLTDAAFRTGFYLDHGKHLIVFEPETSIVFRTKSDEHTPERQRELGFDGLSDPRPANKNEIISAFAIGTFEKANEKIHPLFMIEDESYFAVPPYVLSEPTKDEQLTHKKYVDDAIVNAEDRLSEIYAKKVTEFGNIIKFLGKASTITPMNVGFQALPDEAANEQSAGISFISNGSDYTGYLTRQVAADTPRRFLHSFLNEDSIAIPATKTEVGTVYTGEGSKTYFTGYETVENGEIILSNVEKIFTPDGEVRIDTYDKDSNLVRSKQWRNFNSNTTNTKYGIFSVTKHDITFKQPGDAGIGANSIWDTIKLGFTAATNVFNLAKFIAGANELTNVGLKVDIVKDTVYCGSGNNSLTMSPDEILFSKDVYVEIPETNGLSKAMLVKGIMDIRDDPVLFTNGGTTNFPWAAIGLGISAASSVFNLVKSIVKKNGGTEFTDVGLKIDPINDVTTYGVNTNLIRISDSTISIGDEDHSTNDEKEIVLQRPTYIMCEVPGSNGLWEKLKAVAEKTWFGNVLRFFGFKGAADAVDVGYDAVKRVFNVGAYLSSTPVRMQLKPDLSSPSAILQTGTNWINIAKDAIQIGRDGISENGTTEIVLSGDAYVMQEVPDSNGLWEKIKLMAQKTWLGNVMRFFGFNGAADAVDIGFDVIKRVFNIGAYLTSSPTRLMLKPDVSSPSAVLQTGQNWINIAKDVIQIGTDGTSNENTDIIIRANNGNKILVNDTAIQLASGSSLDLAATSITLSTLPTVTVTPPITYSNSLVTRKYVEDNIEALIAPGIEPTVKTVVNNKFNENNTFGGINTFNGETTFNKTVYVRTDNEWYLRANYNGVSGSDFAYLRYSSYSNGVVAHIGVKRTDQTGETRLRLSSGNGTASSPSNLIYIDPAGKWHTVAQEGSADSIEIIDNTPSNYPFQEYVVKNDCGEEYLERAEKIVLLRCYENNQLVYRWGVKNITTNQIHPIL